MTCNTPVGLEQSPARKHPPPGLATYMSMLDGYCWTQLIQYSYFTEHFTDNTRRDDKFKFNRKGQMLEASKILF